MSNKISAAIDVGTTTVAVSLIDDENRILFKDGFLNPQMRYGSDVLSKGRYDKCYDKALKVRRLARNSADRLFAEYAALLYPACTKSSYTKADLGDSIDAASDEAVLSSLVCLLGLPCAVASGVQIAADTLSENLLLAIAAAAEEG